MANWERKSSYILREIVKFRTYIDCLQAAQAQKEKIHVMRAATTSEEQGKNEDEKKKKKKNEDDGGKNDVVAT